MKSIFWFLIGVLFIWVIWEIIIEIYLPIVIWFKVAKFKIGLTVTIVGIAMWFYFAFSGITEEEIS